MNAKLTTLNIRNRATPTGTVRRNNRAAYRDGRFFRTRRDASFRLAVVHSRNDRRTGFFFDIDTAEAGNFYRI
jgi:hypothetical protein